MPEERPSPETILEYLYGLLEPTEATRVRDWLESSEGACCCAEADRAKSLFATAAKMSFPEVKFERPIHPGRQNGSAEKKFVDGVGSRGGSAHHGGHSIRLARAS